MGFPLTPGQVLSYIGNARRYGILSVVRKLKERAIYRSHIRRVILGYRAVAGI